MDPRAYQLFWKKEFVGTVTNIGYVDFPWAGGDIEMAVLSKELREVLEYVDAEVKTEDGLTDWPFPESFDEHWMLVKPDGEVLEISMPVIDFAKGYATWC